MPERPGKAAHHATVPLLLAYSLAILSEPPGGVNRGLGPRRRKVVNKPSGGLKMGGMGAQGGRFGPPNRPITPTTPSGTVEETANSPQHSPQAWPSLRRGRLKSDAPTDDNGCTDCSDPGDSPAPAWRELPGRLGALENMLR